MKNEVYINGIASISAQEGGVPFTENVREYSQNIIPAIPGDYKKYIAGMQLRRMSTAVKMGITAARISLAEAEIKIPDAIITGTGEGSKQDTEKFLEAMLGREEEMLTPTSFIQSTHNTVGGQIALNLGCTAYNVTYTQSSASFEWALLDALLQFKGGSVKNILVGGAEEISPKITSFSYLNNQLKQEQIKNMELLQSQSIGTITSEGAHFFTLSAQKNTFSYSILADVHVFNCRGENEQKEQVLNFLNHNNLAVQDIDVLILGNNGDSRYDHYYRFLQVVFKASQQLVYKHLVGDYNTVTGYAFWLACKLFKEGFVPEILKLNEISDKNPRTVLIYNQYLGKNHSLTLLKSCEF